MVERTPLVKSDINMEQRHLLVISGPSGIGKDTVVKNLINAHEGIELSVSATTRAPRPGEKPGELYYYLSRQEFERRVEAGEFIEHTEYAGNLYGTLKNEVDKRIKKGITCVLVIEVHGAANVKTQYPDCTTVFIVAPDMAEHERRLRSRGSESEEVIAQRMAIAGEEMKMADDYDFRLVNDDACQCAQRLYDILQKRLEG